MIDKQEYFERRSDPTKTSVRHDEIIALRIFLFDILEMLRGNEDPQAIMARQLILARTKTWGKDKDCV